MKILMLHDCAGVGLELRNRLINRGHGCDLFFFGPIDPYVDYGDGRYRAGSLRTALFVFRKIVGSYDLIHTYNTRFPRHRYPYDYLLAKALGKKVVVHFHGSDLRLFYKTPAVQRLMRNKVCIVSTPDLLEFCPYAVWLPNPVDPNVFYPTVQEPHDEIRILHSSTDAKIKGTEFLVDAVNELRKSYSMNIDLKIAGAPPWGTRYPRSEMPRLINWSDLVVNEVLLPLHSLFGIEAMLCEKPVFSSYKIDRKISNPPIWDISKETLVDDLLDAIMNLNEYRMKAVDGRRWAIENHDPEKVTDKLLKLYEEA